MPRSPIGGMNNVKIFVLYLMRNINYPMDYIMINDIVMQNDLVMSLDFSEAFHQMLDGGLICEDGKNEHGEPLYSVTSRGALVAETLRTDVYPSILDQSLACALRYIDFQRRGVTVDCSSEPHGDGTYDVHLLLKEREKDLLSTTLNVDSEYRARQMRQTFRDRPDVVWRGFLALLAGQVDFLFDSKQFL